MQFNTAKAAMFAVLLTVNTLAYGAAIQIQNETPSPIAVTVGLKGIAPGGLTETGGIIDPKATLNYDAGVGGFKKITWSTCVREGVCEQIYEAKIDIGGVFGGAKNLFIIGAGGSLFQGQRNIFELAKSTRGTKAPDAACPCVLRVK